MWTTIAAQISQAIAGDFQVVTHHSVGGGCINQGYALQGNVRTSGADQQSKTFFVKLNQAAQLEMFVAEALGLKAMHATATIRVPQPICWGTAGNSAYLVLEWVDLGGGDRQTWAELGRQLANLHRTTSDLGFGWDHDNTIGATPQINPWTASWAEFFAKHRLEYQFKLAQRRGGQFPKQNELLAAIPTLLADHNPQPSLVHGDLWSGNAAVTQQKEPIIFDPAVYFGDREVDLAMTELFGGFPSDFYQGYSQTWAIAAGYEQRKTLYNLYHILNHFNLFGGSYQSQANRMIQQLLS